MRDIHDGITDWHEADDDERYLHEYLGLTWEQYSRWAEGGPLPAGCGLYDSQRKEAGS